MKKCLWLVIPSLLLGCGAAALSFTSAKETKADATPTYASSVPGTNIVLTDNTDNEIKAYYSSLNGLSDSELQGTNLLKHLKPILQDFTYYSYDNVWKIYEITDREWELSPATADTYNGTSFDAGSNTYTKYAYGSNQNPGNDPYVHTLYRNRDESGITLQDGRIKNWGDHTGNNATNREHVWCQSRGFKAPSGAEGPAGTDVHHLISGDCYVNITPHNNTPYGFVNPSAISIDSANTHAWLAGNLKGTPTVLHANDVAKTVFEPQDCDKGDIARALFYMAACYNNFSGNDTISQYNPNLLLADFATSDGSAEASSEDHAVTMGTLSDLLSWHKMDPVDEYEIHRNNLIFNNYQHNRNPFIDYPEWVDYIWGTTTYDTEVRATLTFDTTPTGHADLSKDVINGYRSPDPDPDPEPQGDFDPEYEPENGNWIKASNIQIGDEVTLVEENTGKALSDFYLVENKTHYGIGESVTISDSVFSSENGYRLTVCQGSANNTFAFRTGDDKYLCWKSGNSLTVSEDVTSESSWTVTFENGEATITNKGDTGRKIYWNKSSPRFACYTDTSNIICAITLYKTVTSSAINWSSSFLSTWTAGCDPNGVNSAIDWDGAKAAFNSLHSLVKTKLKNKTVDNTVIGRAMQRYDYIAGKYSLENFIDRTPVNSLYTSVPTKQNNAGFAWILVVLLASCVVVTPMIVIAIKRRRNHE